MLGAAELELPDQEALTVGTYLSQWLSHTRARVRRPTTYEGAEAIVRRNASPRIGHLRLELLRPLDLQDLYTELLGEGRLGSGPS